MTEVVKLNNPLVLRCELDEILLMRCECERISKEDQDFGPFELRYEPLVAETRIKDESLWSDVKTRVLSLSDSGKTIFEISIVFRLGYRFTGKTPDEQELRAPPCFRLGLMCGNSCRTWLSACNSILRRCRSSSGSRWTRRP